MLYICEVPLYFLFHFVDSIYSIKWISSRLPYTFIAPPPSPSPDSYTYHRYIDWGRNSNLVHVDMLSGCLLNYGLTWASKCYPVGWVPAYSRLNSIHFDANCFLVPLNNYQVSCWLYFAFTLVLSWVWTYFSAPLVAQKSIMEISII